MLRKDKDTVLTRTEGHRTLGLPQRRWSGVKELRLRLADKGEQRVQL